jgi:hypothetical protein
MRQKLERLIDVNGQLKSFTLLAHDHVSAFTIEFVLLIKHHEHNIVRVVSKVLLLVMVLQTLNFKYFPCWGILSDTMDTTASSMEFWKVLN